ncbi:hypothetical protein [Flavobacterium sp. FlaQc-48]
MMKSTSETESVFVGFAFTDVLAHGSTAKINQFRFDIRSGFHHVSNTG